MIKFLIDLMTLFFVGLFGWFFCFIEVLGKAKKLTPAGLQRKGDSVQTAIVMYEHKETNRRVVIIGNSHLGQEAYHRLTQSLLEAYESEGYKVLYEMIRQEKKKELELLNESEKRYLDNFMLLQRFYLKMSAFLDVVHQFSVLSIKKSWTNTDVDAAEFAKMMSSGENRYDFNPRTYKTAMSILNYLETSTTGIMVRKKFSIFFLGEFYLLRMIKMIKRSGQHIIKTDRRDVLAANAILKYAQTSNVISLWGAGHLDRIPLLLKKEGYQEIGRSWLTAYRG